MIQKLATVPLIMSDGVRFTSISSRDMESWEHSAQRTINILDKNDNDNDNKNDSLPESKNDNKNDKNDNDKCAK
jgi:hypothetical protein